MSTFAVSVSRLFDCHSYSRQARQATEMNDNIHSWDNQKIRRQDKEILYVLNLGEIDEQESPEAAGNCKGR
jgi:hypothetical protein